MEKPNGSYDMLEPILRQWTTNNNINLFLLEATSSEALEASVPNGGRSVGQIFRHMVEVRNQWLAGIDSDHVGEKLPKSVDVRTLVQGFSASAAAVADVITQLGDPHAKVKGFGEDLTAFVMYLSSHDAHHRGQILLTLRIAGHRLDSKVSYGLWDWRARKRRTVDASS